jgi:hypothetical protein
MERMYRVANLLGKENVQSIQLRGRHSLEADPIPQGGGN